MTVVDRKCRTGVFTREMKQRQVPGAMQWRRSFRAPRPLGFRSSSAPFAPWRLPISSTCAIAWCARIPGVDLQRAVNAAASARADSAFSTLRKPVSRAPTRGPASRQASGAARESTRARQAESRRPCSRSSERPAARAGRAAARRATRRGGPACARDRRRVLRQSQQRWVPRCASRRQPGERSRERARRAMFAADRGLQSAGRHATHAPSRTAAPRATPRRAATLCRHAKPVMRPAPARRPTRPRGCAAERNAARVSRALSCRGGACAGHDGPHARPKAATSPSERRCMCRRHRARQRAKVRRWPRERQKTCAWRPRGTRPGPGTQRVPDASPATSSVAQQPSVSDKAGASGEWEDCWVVMAGCWHDGDEA